jgi:hypothetical protein
MSEHPIIFSPESVAAILSGPADRPCKRQTRRIIKGATGAKDIWAGEDDGLWVVERFGEPCQSMVRCPYAQYTRARRKHLLPTKPDRLWVKETCWRHADGRILRMGEQNDGSDGWRKRSPMFMPRSASRLTLEVVSVRAERLQDISFDDCLAEGVIWTRHWNDVTCEELPEGAPEGATPEEIEASIDEGWTAYVRAAFRRMWDAVNAERGYPWESNPWVWAVEFRRLEEETAHLAP